MDLIEDISDRLLLDHPFYRRWEAGELSRDELTAYAEQYRHFEAQLPSFLEALLAIVPAADRPLIEANLADEVAGPATHLELFDRFCASVDATSAAASPAMSSLTDLYEAAVASNDASFAVGVLAGYEVQAAEVAATKGAGLTEHYGVEGDGVAFWSLHAELEAEHAAWTVAAASALDEERVREGARASAEAWWRFLDEREALAA